MKNRIVKTFVTVLMAVVLSVGCAGPSDEKVPAKAGERSKGTMNSVIYLAGGCFWGMEKLAAALPGVTNAVSGYANGKDDITPTYDKVCRGGTGYKEAVKVEYDSEAITLEQILTAYFLVIDPTIRNRQGNDVGEQYQTGIYYSDSKSAEIVERIVAEESKRYKDFAVEHEALTKFYDAEAYHQDYLEKNPGGYCHIPGDEIDAVVALVKAERSYSKPSDEDLKKRLSALQYEVTQNAATEQAFTGEFWKEHRRGIYVDITTGQPLFSSRDKYDSSCGWPAFTAPILAGTINYNSDNSYGMRRTEVTGALSSAHLGHVFENDPESPNGTRYCINSASLRFVPLEDMKKEGYGAYLILNI